MIRSPADGYTLLLTNPTNAINATFYPHLNYDFLWDTDPVAGIVRLPNVMVVGAAVPAHSVPEFIAYTKAKSLLCIAGQRDTPQPVGGTLQVDDL
jgi:tripartite-type tricarboxylate transporter receptor subunit TctC